MNIISIANPNDSNHFLSIFSRPFDRRYQIWFYSMYTYTMHMHLHVPTRMYTYDKHINLLVHYTYVLFCVSTRIYMYLYVPLLVCTALFVLIHTSLVFLSINGKPTVPFQEVMVFQILKVRAKIIVIGFTIISCG